MTLPTDPMDVYYDADYVAAGRLFDTTRKSGLLAEDLLRRPVDGLRLVAPEPATREDLERIHDRSYVDAVLTGTPRAQAASAGLGWDPGFVRSLLASTGGCIAAARAAWERGVSGSLSSGLHHARRDRGHGYCTINGLAAAVRTFQDLGARRVLVIDLDAHGGGGTHDIVGGDELVIQLDITTDCFDRYRPDPWSTLDHIDDADAYLDTIRARLDGLGHGSVDAVAYNAGMDPHEDCTIGGLSGITADVLAERERLVFDWAAAAAPRSCSSWPAATRRAS